MWSNLNNMALIQVHIARWCSSCAHSRHLAMEIIERYPQIDVELIEISTIAEEDLPEMVFATQHGCGMDTCIASGIQTRRNYGSA